MDDQRLQTGYSLLPQFVWAGWLLVVLVDGGSDFPGAIPREAAQPSEGTQQRTPRQSPGQESFSFQVKAAIVLIFNNLFLEHQIWS